MNYGQVVGFGLLDDGRREHLWVSSSSTCGTILPSSLMASWFLPDAITGVITLLFNRGNPRRPFPGFISRVLSAAIRSYYAP